MAAVLLDLFYLGRNYTPAISPETSYPHSPVIGFLKENLGAYRLAATGSKTFAPNVSAVHGLHDIRGYDAIEPREYMEMCIAAFRIAEIPPKNFLFHTHQDFSSPLANMLGMKYLITDATTDLASTQKRNTERFRIVWQNAYCRVYENAAVLPGYFLADKVIVLPDKQQRLQRIASWQGVVREAILTEPLPHTVKPTPGIARRIYLDSRGALYQVKLKENGFLVLALPWSPGWQANLDTSPTRLFQTNQGMLGAVIPRGEHQLHLHYKPPWLTVGSYISLMGSTALILLLFFLKSPENSAPPQLPRHDGEERTFERKSPA
jgi:hypothetical protein